MGTEKPSAVISRSPSVMSGTRVFAGIRVPVQSLLDYLAGGHSLEEFLDDFPTVRREQALKLLRTSQKEIDSLWSVEVERRISEVESGKVATIPGNEVFDKIRERFGR